MILRVAAVLPRAALGEPSNRVRCRSSLPPPMSQSKGRARCETGPTLSSGRLGSQFSSENQRSTKLMRHRYVAFTACARSPSGRDLSAALQIRTRSGRSTSRRLHWSPAGARSCRADRSCRSTPSASRRTPKRGGWDPALYLYGRRDNQQDRGRDQLAGWSHLHGFEPDHPPPMVRFSLRRQFLVRDHRAPVFRPPSGDEIVSANIRGSLVRSGKRQPDAGGAQRFPRRSICCLSTWTGTIFTFGMP